MTRNEFLENVTTFGDLKDFCCDEDCSLLEDVYDEEGRDDYINECLMDWAREDSWQDLYSRLDSIPTGYDWYRYDDYGDWCGLDDEDFEDYKGDVLEWADDHGVWDDDEEEDMDEDCFEDEPEDDEPAPRKRTSPSATLLVCASLHLELSRARTPVVPVRKRKSSAASIRRS